MKRLETKTSDIKEFPSLRRKPISMSQEVLVKAQSLLPEKTLPLVVEPAVDGLRLLAWAENNQDFIRTHMLRHGGILFQGFDVKSVSEFEQFIKISSGDWAEYREPATPRTQVIENIFTSTEYPADKRIFLHNENSHCESWPMKIFFFCLIHPSQGGETPIADCREVYNSIDPKIRERFIEKKIMYVRNFGDGPGFPWQTVFKTDDVSEVNEYCRKNGIEAQWKDGNRLRICYVREAVARHPQTGEMLWFNHAAFFNISTLEPAVREMLSAEFRQADLPYNTYYGNGSTIEPSVLDELRAAYERETVTFPWQQGDILMLDNMLTAHGRSPYSGSRRILVGMTEPIGSKEIERV